MRPAHGRIDTFCKMKQFDNRRRNIAFHRRLYYTPTVSKSQLFLDIALNLPYNNTDILVDRLGRLPRLTVFWGNPFL